MHNESQQHRESGISALEMGKQEKSFKELTQELLEHADESLRKNATDIRTLVGEDTFQNQYLAELSEARQELQTALQNESTNSTIEKNTRSIEEIQSAITFDKVSSTEFANLVSEANKNSQLKEQLIGEWEHHIGTYAKKIFEDPTYAKNIEALWRDVSKPIGEGGPKTLENTTIQNIIALNEIMGANAVNFTKACDLSSKTNDLEYDSFEGQSALDIRNVKIDEKTGELLGEVKLTLAYIDQTGEQCDINRILTRSKNEQGEIEKSVYHERFALPNSIQEGGIAGKVLKESLQEYDKMGVQRIDLHANISVGGYAWASYGFEFDKNHHSETDVKEIAEQCKDRLDIVLATMDFFEETFDDEKDDWVKKAKIPALQEPLEKTLKSIANAKTPQEIAAAGIDGPFFCRDKNDEWHIFEKKDEAKIFSQKLKAENNEHPDYKGALHAGKMVLLGSDWYGSIDLQQNGPSKGKNRKLLESALASK